MELLLVVVWLILIALPLVCGLKGRNPSGVCYVLKLTQSDIRLDEIGKRNCVFKSNVLSVIRKRNWWVAKNIKSCFHIHELSLSPHNRRLGDKLAGKVWKTRNRQACAFRWSWMSGMDALPLLMSDIFIDQNDYIYFIKSLFSVLFW